MWELAEWTVTVLVEFIAYWLARILGGDET
jgi:hypothetical protein